MGVDDTSERRLDNAVVAMNVVKAWDAVSKYGREVDVTSCLLVIVTRRLRKK